MKKFTFFLALLFAVPLAGKAIDSINIHMPQPDWHYRESMNIIVELTGNASVTTDTVIASVGNKRVILSYTYKQYEGSLSLAGMKPGALELVVVAKDVAGNTKTATQTFIHDRSPIITIESPISNSSNQSKLHIKATIVDSGHVDCRGIVSINRLSIPFVNSIDTLIDPYPDLLYITYPLNFYWVDSLDRSIFIRSITVSSDRSSYLVPVYTDSSLIMDVDSTRILSAVLSRDSDRPGFRIYNRVTSASKFIDLDSYFPPPPVYAAAGLYKGGAFFIPDYYNLAPNHVYLWHGDSLINISAPLGTSCQVRHDLPECAGNTLMWTTMNGQTAITDLTTLKTTFTGVQESINGGYGKDLSPDGKKIVYAAGAPEQNDIYSYIISTQVVTKITTSGNNVVPAVDGNNITYVKLSGLNNTNYLNDGVTDYRLGSVDHYYKTTHLFDGYVAYGQLDSMNVQQLWLRNPAKELKKITSGPIGSEVDKLGSDGRFIFLRDFVRLNGSRTYMRYYSDSTTTIVPIASSSGKTFFARDSFYLAIGGTLYAFNIPKLVLPPKITTITPDSAIAGTTVTIRGLHLSYAVEVLFGGKTASDYTVISDSVITAIVGEGSSGAVSVITPAGTDTLSGFHFAFNMPQNYFAIIYTNATCRGAKNGSILVADRKYNPYRIVISGTQNLDTIMLSGGDFTMNNFAAGTYNICLSLVAHPGYQQCFTSEIFQPQDLSAYIAVKPDDRQLNLLLTGAELYHIKLNGNEITTTDSVVTLDLKQGLNKVAVSTDKLCQGTISREIFIGADLVAYPNPFQKTIHLNLGKETVQRALITLYDTNGKIFYTRAYTNQSGVVTIDLPVLSNGLYMLKLSTDNQETIFKLMKN